MPKSTNDLWNKVVSWDNLYDSFLTARDGHKTDEDVLAFYSNLEENLTNIHNHLIHKSWEPSPYQIFWRYEPKSRLIHAPPFKDRVVHHALVDIIEPYFECKMIYHSYACRIGKGTHSAAKKVQHDLRVAQRNWGRVCVLQADISAYFASINHRVILNELSKTIRDKDVLWLCAQIILKSGYDVCGIPVGALTSQLCANTYLSILDHKIKDDWGIKHYTRYMDDFVILGPNKAELREVLSEIKIFLSSRLHLALNPKTQIYPAANRLVDFVGYRISSTHMLPRKRIAKRAKAAFSKLSKQYSSGEIDLDYVRPRVMSFLGYMKHCDSFRTAESVLEELCLIRNHNNDSSQPQARIDSGLIE